MKKLRLIALLFCAIISGVVLISCGQGNNPRAEFSVKEIVLSKAETIDFLQYVKSENVNSNNLQIEIVPSNLVDKVNDTYQASTPGRGSVHIKYNGNLLASCPLIVKQKFTTPSNIKVDENGVISWDKASVYDEGAVVTASNYILKLNNQDFQVTGQNQYLLTEAGSYDIQVKAVGNKYIEDSDFSSPQIINYNVMPSINIQRVDLGTFFGGQNIMIRWEAIAHAKYNIEYNGFIISQGQSENYVDINCGGLNAGEIASVIIEVCDTNENAMLSSRTRLNLKKLGLPSLKYENGKVECQSLTGTESLMIQYILENGVNGVVEVLPEEFKLDGLPSGSMQLNVQARGGVNYNEIYVNSDISSINIYKLEQPNFYYELTAQGLQLKFNNQTYIKNYKIVYGEHELEHNVSQGSTLILPISSFDKGHNEVKIYSLPSFNDGQVLPFEEYDNVVSSTPRVVDIYVLNNAESISHTISDKTVTLTFAAVEYADNYTLNVNGTSFNEFTIKNNKVSFEINLAEIAPNESKYNFDIQATREDNMAKDSHSTYTLTVLDKTTKAQEQENGSFMWNAIENADYKYLIYRVDADFDETSDALPQPFARVDRTQNTQIEETLDFGYYYIEVYSISQGGQYLDSDFYDAANILKSKFFVYKQIESPVFEFTQKDNKYGLNITKVDNAHKYTIYIDGVKEGDVYDNNPSLNTLVYNFENSFASAKQYEICVEASAGSKYDGTIHTTSEKTTIYVTRLAKPKFSVSDKQYLTVECQAYSNGVIIKLGQQVLNTENQMGVDLRGYNDDFILTIQALPQEGTNTHYYLNSAEYYYNFKRVSAPSAINYNTGILNFTSVDHDLIENYLITLTLVNDINGDYEEVTSCLDVNFNLAQFIQTKLLSTLPKDEAFKSAYQQCQYIKISVSAYSFGLKRVGENDVFLLPSALGTTSTGQEQLQLHQLGKTSITFDTSTNTLSWTQVGDSQTRYSIYANGALIKDNLIGESANLDDVDFLDPTEIYVFAVNPAYLSSTNSNLIIIEKLAKVQAVNVDNHNSCIHFTVNTSRVAKVLCDGQEVAIGANGYVSINLEGNTNLSLKLIAKESVTQASKTYYYIDSETIEYNFKNLNLLDFNLSLSEGLLSWNALATDFTMQPSPLSYKIQIDGENGQAQVIEGLKTCQYNLDDEVLYKLSIGLYSLKVVAVIENYTIDGGANSIGYYSSKESNVLQLEKLKTLENVWHEVILNQDYQKETDKLIKANIQFKWKDIWSDVQNISFNITINDSTLATAIKNGDIFEKYNLSQNEDGEYIFTISQEYFKCGDNKISLVVNGDNSITSNVYTYSLYRYNNISSLTISDDGILQIEVSAQEQPGFNVSNKIKNFMVGVTIDGVTTYQSFNSTAINIMTQELLARGSGNYSVEVVGYDQLGQFLATELKANLSGYRLNGINSVEITPTGDINISLYNENEIDNDIRFVVSYTGKIFTFEPTRVNDSAIFTYSMEQFIKLLSVQNFGKMQLAISVQKQGAINADFVNLSFDYLQEPTEVLFARGRDYAEDYIKVPLLEQENTTSFRIMISYLTDDGIAHSLVKTYLASELRGYWINTEAGGYFVKELPPNIDASQVEQCYALLVNDLAAVIQKGQLTIRVSRVAMQDGGYQQYNGNEKTYTKLCTISGITLRDDILSWNASTEPEALGYYVYIYYNNGNDYFQKVFAPSASLNLMSINFVPNRAYSLRIVTVSVNDNVLASNVIYNSNSEITKYSSPTSLQVEDGVITFNLDAVKNSELLTTIEKAYNSQGLSKDEQLGMINKAYTDFFCFSPSNISSLTLRLIFTKGGLNYITKVNPVRLLPDLSKLSFAINGGSGSMTYIAALEGMLNGAPTSSQNAIFVRQLYDEIKGQNGIATNDILFNSFASSVAAGQYALSARQEGVSRYRTITSEQSVSIDVAVGEAPSITLSRKTIEGKNHYYLSFLSSMIATSKDALLQKANRYVMLLKNDNNNYYFNIVCNEGEYYIDGVTGSENSKLNLKLDSTPLNDRDSVIIDFSKLLALTNIVKSNYSMTVYTYGNSYTINSKTDDKTLTLLEINAQSLALSNGILTWRGTAGYNTQLIYKRSGQEVDSPKEITSSNGMFELILQNSGLYDYVILSILGSVGTNSMTIDSDSYKIENIVKLSAPNVQVNAKNFVITDNVANNMYNPNVSFMITNNAYSGIPYTSNSSTNKQFEYVAGANSQYEEDKASIFYFASMGAQNVSFEISEKQDGDSDFILTPQTGEKYLLLSSEYTQLQAALLNKVTQFNLRNGDFEWSMQENKVLTSDTTLIYKLIVEYYKTGQTQMSVSREFYTIDTSFDTLKIEDPDSGSTYSYKVYVTTLGMVKGSERDHDIVTVDGGYYKYASLKYQDGSYLLGSLQSQVSVGNNAVKVFKKSDTVSSFNIEEGSIKLTTTTSGLSWHLVDNAGKLVSTNKHNNNYDEEDGKVVSCIQPKFVFENNPYKLYAYNYGSDNSQYIKSNLVMLKLDNGESNVYKLPSVEENDFTIVRGESSYLVDLTKLYNNKKIFGTDNYYQVELTIQITLANDSRTYSTSINTGASGASSKHKLYLIIDNAADQITFSGSTIIIPSKATSIKASFKVYSNEITKSHLFLNGDVTMFDITPLSFSKDDQLVWNDQLNQFEWTLQKSQQAKQNEDAAQFRITINYEGLESEIAETSDFILDNNGEKVYIYKPMKMGKILSVQINARKNSSALYSLNSLTLNQTIIYDLFASGDGTIDNPYIIATAVQFSNMRFRNSSQYYFKQSRHLLLSAVNFAFDEVFYGNYDGDNLNLTFVSEMIDADYQTTGFNLTQSFVTTASPLQVNFNDACAVFKELAKGSTIKNLKLYFENNRLIKFNTMISGLSWINRGQIENIVIASVQNDITFAQSQNLALAQSGIAAVNYGTIINVANNSDITINAITTVANQLYLSPFVITNQSANLNVQAVMLRCNNNGKLSVNARRRNAQIRIAGVALNNVNGKISQCGNNADIEAVDASLKGAYSSFIAGIVLRFDGGELSFSYNKGNLTSSAVTSNNSGGVAYQLNSGKINSLVEASKNYIAFSCKSSVNNIAPSYCYAEYPTTNIVTQEISAKVLRCDNEYSLVIVKLDNGYDVSINKV